MNRNAGLSLICRVETRLCALPVESVLETMRPLAVEPVVGTPDCVLGLSIIRGVPVPIVDAARLLGGQRSTPARLVILKIGERRVALGVDAVIGLRSVGGALAELPPLLRNADADMVAAIGALDSELLLILKAMRVLSEDVLAGLESRALAS